MKASMAKLEKAHAFAHRDPREGRDVKLGCTAFPGTEYVRGGELFSKSAPWVAARVEDGPITLALQLTPAGARAWAAELVKAADEAEATINHRDLDGVL